MSKPIRPQTHPALRQKTATQPPIQQKRTPPVAPPVYRPQPLPKVLQRKVAATNTPANHSGHTPAAPPVYRPQPTPKVLQLKQVGQPPPTAAPPPLNRPRPSSHLQPLPGQSARAQQAPPRQRTVPTIQPAQAHTRASPARTGPTAGAGRAGAGTVQAKQSSVIQLDADEDLKSAGQNFKYGKGKAEILELRGGIVALQVKKLLAGTKTEKKVGEEMAHSLFKFTQGVLDQYEGHYQELKEVSRLLNKPANSRRLPVLSTDKNTDPDLAYVNSKGKTVAKEVKAISSDNTGTVTQRIKEAISQLGKRQASRKKVLVVITEPTNSWPFNKGEVRNSNQIEAKFRTKTSGLDIVNYDEICVRGITDDKGDSYTAMKRWKSGKWVFDVIPDKKHPSTVTPKKDVKKHG